jgi:hypothetical protein
MSATTEGTKLGLDLVRLNKKGGVEYFHMALKECVEEDEKKCIVYLKEAMDACNKRSPEISKILVLSNSSFIFGQVYVNDVKKKITREKWLHCLSTILYNDGLIVDVDEDGDQFKLFYNGLTDTTPFKLIDIVLQRGYTMLVKEGLVVEEEDEEEKRYSLDD